jgi:hypothetical protein
MHELGRGQRARRPNKRIFATIAALTSKGQRGPPRSKVVLDQAILGLLINRAARVCRGELSNRADLGRDSPMDESPSEIR